MKSEEAMAPVAPPVPTPMEKNIKRISIAWSPWYSQARSQAKIPEGAESFTMKFTRQGNNGGELLYLPEVPTQGAT